MMSLKLSSLFPCVSFFSKGRLVTASLVLLMQLSIILWPIAVRWARTLNERHGVEKLLAELSETHRVPSDPYAAPTKRFRQLA